MFSCIDVLFFVVIRWFVYEYFFGMYRFIFLLLVLIIVSCVCVDERGCVECDCVILSVRVCGLCDVLFLYFLSVGVGIVYFVCERFYDGCVLGVM